MTKPRSIAIVTGTRAEFGLLSHLMRALQRRSDVSPLLIATGTHFDPRFGESVKEIEAAGIPIAAKVPMSISGDRGEDVAHAMAQVTAGMADAFSRLQPDMIVVLGDRFEMLATVSAATAMRIPVAHIHGGELSEGVIDDSMRHAITKLSHLHLASAPAYRDRIIQMGEDPARVLVPGALAVDAVSSLKPIARPEIEARLGIRLGAPLFLVTYHPETAARDAGSEGIEPLIAALGRFPEATVVITGVNADAGHSAIASALTAYADANAGRVVLKNSLGQALYLAVMSNAAAVIGNSSSGVIEAPIMRVPTVNIGDRQRGRLMPSSVISCPPEADAIEAAIRKAIEWGDKVKEAHGADFGKPGVGDRMAEVLATIELAGLTRKRFRDLAGNPVSGPDRGGE
jgi:UDP-hydrolysing UDP-N-acetyl-D-glucosamine 2-epimerase